jgi:hypothetical protein
MEEPFTHQNPMAMFHRYRLQQFETVVYQMEGAPPDDEPPPPPPPIPPASNRQTLEELKALHETLQKELERSR